MLAAAVALVVYLAACAALGRFIGAVSDRYPTPRARGTPTGSSRGFSRCSSAPPCSGG